MVSNTQEVTPGAATYETLSEPHTSAPSAPYSPLWRRLWTGACAALVLLFLVQPVLKLTYGPDELAGKLENGVPHGFYAPDTDPQGNRFAWTEPRAYVLLDYFSRKPLQITMTLRSAVPFGGPDEPVRVLANGVEIAALHPNPATNDYQTTALKISPAQSGQSQLRLDIIAAPFNANNRVQGAAFRSISIDKTEAWSGITRRVWLYWTAVGLLALLPVLAWAGRRRRSAVTGYAMVALCGVGLLAMGAALVLLLRIGMLDWAASVVWFVCTLYLALAFAVGAAFLPSGASGSLSLAARAYAWAGARGLPFTGARTRYRLTEYARRLRSVLAKFWLNSAEPTRIWAGARIALFLLPIVNEVLFHHFEGDPDRPFSPDTWMERLVWPWTRWDGREYIRIASTGYTEDMLAAWYPFYPMAIRAASLPFALGDSSPAPIAVAAILVSSLAALATCVLLYRLAVKEFDRDTARLSVLYLMAFPTAFFMFATYTESMFLALAVGAFLAARNRRWLLALSLAALAALTKNQGVFVALALLVEYAHQIGWSIKRIDWRIFLFALPPIAFGLWVLTNLLVYGNPLFFLSIQGPLWGRHYAWPWEPVITVLVRYFQPKETGTWLPTPPNVQFYEVPLMVMFLILGFVANWATWKGRLRPAYTVFFWGCLLQPLADPSGEGNELYSMSRLVLIMFPAFFILAWAGKRWPTFNYTYLAIAWPLLALFFSRFSLWYWLA